jgi:hypothetical protein
MRMSTSQVRSTLVSTFVALVVGLACATPATAASPLRCGDTVTGTAALTTNLRCTTGPGLVLAPGASLDLQGHTLTGPGAASGEVGLLADFQDVTDPVAVRNGTVRGWGTGLSMVYGPGSGSVDAVTFRDNQTAVYGENLRGVDVAASRFVDNGGGIISFYVSSTTVDRSTFRGNGTGVTVAPGGGMVVTDSTFTDNGTATDCSEAVLTVSGSTFTRNTVAATGAWCGLTLTGNVLAGNDTGVTSRMITPESDNGWFYDEIVGNRFTRNGVALEVGVSTLIRGNTFVRNDTGVLSTTYGHEVFEVQLISLDGNWFDRNGDAVYIDSDVLVKDTLATRGTGYGIYTPRATDLGGNVAWGNAVEPQCTGVVCTGAGS